MKKKLTAVLLALTMALALLPAAALASPAEPTHPEDLIASINFYYRSPDVVPENQQWDTRIGLRNVFSVRLKTPCDSASAVRNTYSFAVKAGSSGSPTADYHEVQTVYVSDPIFKNQYSVVYFEAPAGVLSADEKTYTIRIIDGSGNYDEESITLSKVTFKNSDNADVTDPWVDDDAAHILKDGGSCCILVSATDSYPAFPSLKDRENAEFIGWSKTSGSQKSELIEKIDADTPLYPVFGERVKRVLTVRTTDAPDGQEVMWQKPAAHSTEYAAQTPLTLYIRNEGNVKYEKVYTVSSDHLDMTYVPTGDVTSVAGAGRECYDIPAGKTLKVQFTPKAGLPQGEYFDSVTLHNDTDRVIRYIEIRLTVTAIKVEITATEITKAYGETKSSSDVQWEIVGREDAGALKETLSNNISFASDGFEAAANANENGYDITIQNAATGNYTVTWKDGVAPKVKVNKAVPHPSVEKPEVSIMVTHKLDDVKPTVDFTDPTTGAQLSGTIAWQNGAQTWDKSGVYEAAFTFTPDNGTNYAVYTGTATVHVSEKYTVDLKPVEDQDHTVTYDGAAHKLDFQIVPDHDNYDADASEIGAITVTYRKQNADGTHGEALTQAPTDAGIYTVTASTQASTHFAADTSTATLTILPKELTVSATVNDKPYDGSTAATVSAITVTGKVGADDVSVNKDTSTASFDNANAGAGKTVTVTLGELTGEKAGNYTLPAGHQITATASVTKKAATLRLKAGMALTKTYGETFVLSLTDQFEIVGLVEGESLGIAVTGELSCAGVGPDAVVNADGYPVTFIANEGNYDVTLSDTALTVTKAAPKLREGTIQTSSGWTRGALETVTLTGEFVNSGNESMIVEGTLAWSQPKMSLSGAVNGKITATWKFTPKDTANYVGTELTGTVDVPVSTSQPVVLQGVEPQIVTYTGQAQGYTVEITAAPAAAITLRYRPHTDTDADHQNTESFTADPPRDAGTYDVLILATPTENPDDQYAENSVVVHLTIEPAAPATTGVGPFSGREGTKLSDLAGLPATLPGVNGELVPGAFAWASPEAAITAETAEFDWSFVPSDPNYKPVAGRSTVTMTDDPRTVTGTVYNLPEGYEDYVAVTLPKDGANVLLPGEIVHFYADAACETLLGSLTVPAEGDAAEVHFAKDALGFEAGTVYAKLAGQKTAVTPIPYDAAIGADIADQTVAVGGTVTLTVKDALRVTWTVPGNGVVTLPEGADLNAAALTLRAAAAGTATVTVTIDYAHPDPAKEGETVTVTRTVTVTVTAAQTPPTPPTPSDPVPSLTPDTPVINGEATAQIAPEAVTGGIADAHKAGGDTVTVEPQLSGKADKVTVALPQASVAELADADLSLTVKAEDTTLTLSPDALADLNAAGGRAVSVTVEALGNGSTAIDLAVDGKSVTAVKGGVKAQLPAAGDGQVLVAVGPDGTETVIKKSVVDGKRVDALLDGPCTVKVADRSLTFDDVAAGSWYAGAVDFASSHELFNGDTATSFDPQRPMTRGMAATVLWRLENEQDVTDPDTFTDVEAGSWYEDGILWAARQGIVNGYGNGLCGPRDNVTREQLATMLYRYAKLMGLDMTVTGDLTAFADSAAISGYAEDAMAWAVGVGLLQGKENSALDPQGDATRAEVATVMLRLITLMVK